MGKRDEQRWDRAGFKILQEANDKKEVEDENHFPPP
jgi:hypothetical protein